MAHGSTFAASPNNGAIVRTRVATVDDAGELARLNAAFNKVYERPESLAKRLADPRRVETAILGEIAGHAVDFAGLRLAPRLFADEVAADLTELYVEPAYRRFGAGLALIRHAERLAQEAGAREICLATGFHNQAGQAFYGAEGYAEAHLLMRKRLGLGADETATDGQGQGR